MEGSGAMAAVSAAVVNVAVILVLQLVLAG